MIDRLSVMKAIRLKKPIDVEVIIGKGLHSRKEKGKALILIKNPLTSPNNNLYSYVVEVENTGQLITVNEGNLYVLKKEEERLEEKSPLELAIDQVRESNVQKDSFYKQIESNKPLQFNPYDTRITN